MPLTLAHLSDVHLEPIRGLGITHVNIKRVLGYLNWRLKRRRIHLRSVVDRLTADIAAQRPDHVIVTGDLVNLGLPGEIARAAAWLDTLGGSDRVTAIPGNHDIYVRLRRDIGVERWRRFMLSDGEGAAFVCEPDGGFPFVRIIGRVALIGLNSAVPTRPFYAGGRLGAAQLAALERSLDRLGERGLVRVLLIHHPPLPGQARTSRALADAAALEAVLGRCGAELVLHGHNHLETHAERTWSGGTIPVIGAASGSAGRVHGGEPLAAYNLIHIDDAPQPGIEIIRRGLASPDGPVVERGRLRLAPTRQESAA